MALELDLEEITDAYEAGLVDTLRNFGVGGEILDAWVPDADPTKSIINLVDSALVGMFRSELALFVKRDRFGTIDSDLLTSIFGGQVTFNIEESPVGCRITIREWNRSTEEEVLEAINRPSEATKHRTGHDQTRTPTTLGARWEEGSPRNIPQTLTLYDNFEYDRQELRQTINPADNAIEVTTTVGDYSLRLWIDPEDHRIISAKPDGTTPDGLSITNAFCDLIENRPILDASDHGISRLESRIRGREDIPVEGILIPPKIDRRFEQIQILIRGALSEYRKLTNYQEISNHYDPGPAPEWVQLSKNQQLETLNSALSDFLSREGLLGNSLRAVDVEYGSRVLLQFAEPNSLAADSKGTLLMDAEQFLANHLDERLELFLEPVDDQSKLRRLTVEVRKQPE